jgi:hypothetical protein
MPVYADFSLNVGVSLSDERSAKPEVNLPDPLGILRVRYETENKTTIFCEHISSFPLTEKGNGLNHCGFMIKL